MQQTTEHIHNSPAAGTLPRHYSLKTGLLADCKDCWRLLSDYESAAFASVRAQTELEIATYLLDTARIDLLGQRSSVLSARYDAARLALNEHERICHAVAASS